MNSCNGIFHCKHKSGIILIKLNLDYRLMYNLIYFEFPSHDLCVPYRTRLKRLHLRTCQQHLLVSPLHADLMRGYTQPVRRTSVPGRCLSEIFISIAMTNEAFRIRKLMHHYPLMYKIVWYLSPLSSTYKQKLRPDFFFFPQCKKEETLLWNVAF